ncbi:MAG: Hsp20/alpha crystallin family protein [Gemmatimonadaceae bacterium]
MLYRNSLTPPVFGLRREIDRLFEDTFGRGEGGTTFTPAVDIRENQNELSLDVELPGLNPNDVEITAENGVLTIRGEKQTERKEGDDSRYHIIERSYGSFLRSFQLPQGLDESKIEANYNNGILSIHLPKSALAQPKKIQIKSGEVPTGGRPIEGVGTSTVGRRTTTGDNTSQQQPMAASGSSSVGKNNPTSRRDTGAKS